MLIDGLWRRAVGGRAEVAAGLGRCGVRAVRWDARLLLGVAA